MRKRLRKKRRPKHRAQNVLGFRIEFAPLETLERDRVTALLTDFERDVIANGGLSFVGGGVDLVWGFVTRAEPVSATEADREAVGGWLDAREDVARHRVEELLAVDLPWLEMMRSLMASP